jgi:hypothetical protein
LIDSFSTCSINNGRFCNVISFKFSIH